MLVYARTVEVSHEIAVRATTRPPHHVTLDAETSPWVRLVPGLPWLLGAYEASLSQAIAHGSGVRHHVHRSFADEQRAAYAGYLPLRDRLAWPEDLAAVRGAAGILPFHVPDLVVVDGLGLTDATIARAPVPEGRRRHLAHERRAPAGYLASRRAWLLVRPLAPDVETALIDASWAVPLGEGAVLAFDSRNDDEVGARFAGRGASRRTSHARVARRNRLQLHEARWTGEALVATFDAGLDGFSAEGRAAEHQPARRARPGQHAVEGQVGAGFLDTFHPEDGDAATGRMRSPPIPIPAGALLSFRVGGGSHSAVGVRILVDGEEVASRRGRNSEVLGYVWVDLSRWPGAELVVEVFDEATGPWGHVIADHFVLHRRDEGGP